MSIVDCRLQSPTFVRQDDRGSFTEIINNGPWHTVITGTMRAGAVIGNHYHKLTNIYLFLTDGAARVHQVNVATRHSSVCELAASTGVYLEPNHAHAVRFLKASTFVMLKSRPYSDDDADTYAYDLEGDSHGVR